MKIRSGFVSNSSSSSFIIGCDKVPTSIQEMKELLGEVQDLKYCTKNNWTNQEENKYEYITEQQLAEQVFNDMTKINIDDEAGPYEYDKSTHKEVVLEDSYVSIEAYSKEIRKDVQDYFTKYFEIKEEILSEFLDKTNVSRGYIYPLQEFFREIVNPNISKSLDNYAKERKLNPLKLKRVYWNEFDPKLASLYHITEKVINKEVNRIGRKYQELSKENLLKSKEFFSVKYSDEEGAYFSTLEHGNIFRNTKVAIQSMH